MTEVSFHFNVPDRVDYLCRLVRKAVRSGARLVLAGPAAELEPIDRALWAFDETEFLPHLWRRDAVPPPARLAATPVWLAEDARHTGCHEVLVNLGPDPAAGFESFEKLIEIVTGDAADRAQARRRWKHYADRGYAITRHEVARVEAGP